MRLEELPKVELHLHLDGSVRPKTAGELLNKSEKEIEKDMIAMAECNNLNDYLTKFEIPEMIMQTKDNLERVAKELAEDLKKENVIYAEIRFAPMKHVKKGLSGVEVIDSVLNGLKQVDIKTNLILCMMRGSSFKENDEVIELAKKYLNKGVCAIDLAGAEAMYKTCLYKDLFDKYFNVTIVSNKYIYKSNEKATFTLYLTDKSNNIISNLDEKIEVSGDNIKDFKVSKGFATFGFTGLSEATIKVSEGLIEASSKVLCIDDIEVVGIPTTKVRVDDELKVKIQGISNKNIKTSNKQSSNTKKTMDLSSLKNQYILNNGTLEKYEFSNPVITFDETVVEKIDGDNPFEFKLKTIGHGDIKLNVQWDRFNKTTNKYVNP